ncbi:MAG: TAXI family TRAP transporter solute-binding subunit [Clostridia bacterium]|nr:TAXI family TRAP transporter solute-binding subunit [Clostridia bacterium]
MKKLLCVLLALVCLLSCVSCGKNFRFVTGGSAGTYYAFGSLLAQHATNNAGINVTGVEGAGSKGNVEKLDSGDAEFAFCQSDVMASAYKGTNLFKEAITSFSTVAALYTEEVQIVTLNPAITSVSDLEGKRVSVGEVGSGVYFNAVDILNVYGLGNLDESGKFTQINAQYQSFGDSADALKDGTIDAAFIVSGAPTSAVTTLAATKDVYLISLDDAHIDTLLAGSPYYAKCVIGKEVYGTADDVTTVGVGAVILAANSVSEEDVYAFVKDIFESASTETTHPKYKDLNLKYATSITDVPYHPGAAKYFTEKGFTVAK